MHKVRVRKGPEDKFRNFVSEASLLKCMSPMEDFRKIDTHFHIELPHPDWKSSAVTSPIRHSNSSKCILSVITPDPSSEGVGVAGRRLARAINVQTLDTVRSKESKDKFTWFASLPDWSDVEGTIREVEWALGEADADGVVVMPTYQDRRVSSLDKTHRSTDSSPLDS